MWCFEHCDLETFFAPQRCALIRHLNFQKWSKNSLNWKWASCLNSNAFFPHANFQKWSDVRCFMQFDFDMCFAPQWRALFRHFIFQKWSEGQVFLAVLLPAVLCATRVCNFSSLCKPHGLASGLLRAYFFDPTEPGIIWKNTVNSDFPTFSRTCLFFLFILSPLWSFHCFSSPLWLFLSLLLHLFIFFGNLTSKLSIILTIFRYVELVRSAVRSASTAKRASSRERSLSSRSKRLKTSGCWSAPLQFRWNWARCVAAGMCWKQTANLIWNLTPKPEAWGIASGQWSDQKKNWFVAHPAAVLGGRRGNWFKHVIVRALNHPSLVSFPLIRELCGCC